MIGGASTTTPLERWTKSRKAIQKWEQDLLSTRKSWSSYIRSQSPKFNTHCSKHGSYACSFTDFLHPFPLFRGKGSHNDPEDHVGCIKGAIKIHCLHEDGEAGGGTEYNLFGEIPSNCPVDLVVRVYVVKVRS